MIITSQEKDRCGFSLFFVTFSDFFLTLRGLLGGLLEDLWTLRLFLMHFWMEFFLIFFLEFR